MREIKFRVWDIKHKTYTEYRIDNSGFYCMDNFTGCWLKMNNTHFNFIIMQYTGLKDKNGKEICEGDILKDCERKIKAVVWNDNGFKSLYVSHRTYQGEPYTVDVYSNLRQTNDKRWGVEVIGNINENPELLEVD